MLNPTSRLPLTTGLLLALLGGQGASASSVLATYDGSLGGVPQDSACWTLTQSGAAPAPFNDGGAVVIGPTSSAGLLHFSHPLPPISFDDGAWITAQVKVTSSGYYAVFPFRRSGYYIQLRDNDGRWAGLGISSDRVLLMTADQNWGDQTFQVDTTAGYRVYALHFAGDDVEALIDGEVVLTAAAGTLEPGEAIAYFGDLSILAGSQTHTAQVEVIGVTACAPADLDCSGLIDGADLGLLLGDWGTNACTADLNGDGIVDGADLGLLLGAWSN
jgi:hypothetical protein